MADYTGGERHLIFGATPDEEHMVVVQSRSPEIFRLFVDERDVYNGKTRQNFYRGTFNNLQLATHIFHHLAQFEKDGPLKDVMMGRSGSILTLPEHIRFDKIYFDWSTSKYIRWNLLEFQDMMRLLKIGGSIYVPDVIENDASKMHLDEGYPEGRVVIPEANYFKCKEWFETVRNNPEKLPWSPMDDECNMITGYSMKTVFPNYYMRYPAWLYQPSRYSSKIAQVMREMRPIVRAELSVEFHKGIDGYPDIGLDYRADPNSRKDIGVEEVQYFSDVIAKWEYVQITLLEHPCRKRVPRAGAAYNLSTIHEGGHGHQEKIDHECTVS